MPAVARDVRFTIRGQWSSEQYIQLWRLLLELGNKMGPGTAAKQTPDPERGRPTRSGVSRT